MLKAKKQLQGVGVSQPSQHLSQLLEVDAFPRNYTGSVQWLCS